MTTRTKAIFAFLLAAPLLMGAVASKQRAAKNDIVPSQDAVKRESDVQVQSPSMAAQQTLLETPTSDVAVPIPEAASSAANFAIDWYSINGGGTINATSTNYKMGASIGQSVAGAATSTNYQMGIGFWYGAGASGGCACDCHADPANCDGVQNILDVTSLINVAFRGAAAILDPNANCPFETTNVNCDGATSVLDVTLMINVAFRGADPATTFCNPCP